MMSSEVITSSMPLRMSCSRSARASRPLVSSGLMELPAGEKGKLEEAGLMSAQSSACDCSPALHSVQLR